MPLYLACNPARGYSASVPLFYERLCSLVFLCPWVFPLAQASIPQKSPMWDTLLLCLCSVTASVPLCFFAPVPCLWRKRVSHKRRVCGILRICAFVLRAPLFLCVSLPLCPGCGTSGYPIKGAYVGYFVSVPLFCDLICSFVFL